jgi:hypothetical protein
MAFTPSKNSRITREELGLDSDLVLEINPTYRARISSVPIRSAGQAINPQGATWNLVVEYITILENNLPALQNILRVNRVVMDKHFADVEDELGLVVADMGEGGDVPGCPYTSLWSAVGTSFDENRARNHVIASLADF